MDTLNLQELAEARKLAEKQQKEAELLAKLPELERQIKEEETKQRALANAQVLAERLDAMLGEFKTTKKDLDSKLTELLEQAQSLIEARKELYESTEAIYQVARNLAITKLNGGFFDHPETKRDWGRALELGVSHQNAIVNDYLYQEIQSRTGNKVLMIVSEPDDTRQLLLLDRLITMTGDSILPKQRPFEKPPEPQKGTPEEVLQQVKIVDTSSLFPKQARPEDLIKFVSPAYAESLRNAG